MFRFFIAALAGLLLLSSGGFGPALAGELSAAEALKLIQARRYSEAYPTISTLAAASPKDMSLQYYLGLCAEGMKDHPLAELAFCRVIVSKPENNPFAIAAKKALSEFRGHLVPYCSVQKDLTRRWSAKANPLRIWVSDGRTLPAPYAEKIMSAQRYAEATKILQLGQTLAITPSYKPEYRQSVISGLTYWDWAVKDHLFSYRFTESSRDADIVILFVEHPPQESGGFTLYPYVPHQPCIVELKCALERNWTEERWTRQLVVILAHEFGHCLGLADSKSESDLMYMGDNTKVHALDEVPIAACSDNDRATLRAVYSMPADVDFGSARR